MNGNNYHTMSAICNTSSRWIYRELVRDKKILELLSDTEILCGFLNVNFIFRYSCIKSEKLNTQNVSQMCHNWSDQESYTEVHITQS